MKILIAEDNEDSRVLLESALEANGYEVESAENGEIALKLASRRPPDLIISDILMPVMDGYAFCRAVKEDDQLRAIPFIFYTATYTDPSDERLAMDLGASRFIVKPMEIPAFLLEITAVLESHNTEKLSTPDHPLKGEQELEKGYAEVLAKKLDKKVRQLEDEKERLANSEKQYRRLVEALRDDYFFYTHDTNGVVAYISPSIKNVLGYTQEEFLVHYSEYLTDSVINKGVGRFTDLAIKGIKQPPYELEIYHKNGRVHRLEVTEEPILDKHGQVTAVEGIAHDITKRISIEKKLIKAQESLQQSQKMEAIGTLAGGIAHDFNNILTPIIGYAEITQLGLSEGSTSWQNLQEILTAGSRAKELVLQILTFSRQTEKEKKPVLLQALIKEALRLLRSSIPATIEIRESIDPDCPPISANQTQMHQILMNLCTNAYYAMRVKGGILAVSLAEIDISPDNPIANLNLQPGKHLRLEVSDSGIGIEKDKLGRIFEPYFTTKPKDEGTGLGLSVVHGIVTSHGGHISVYSEPGQGTTFHIYLPVIVKQQVTDEPPLTEEVLGGTERIMLVDDEEIIVSMEKQQLESLGYQVTALTNGVDAVEEFRKAPQDTDMVVTDMTMPNITGAELSQQILEIRPDIPIILCTGYSELIDKDKAIAQGIQEYLMKPVSRKDLARAVRKVLDKTNNARA
ncbi:MAG: response regulator [Desulfobulbaceae bacterium]|nr:response regulator [Desulfobulbaceae bacterium]